MTEQGLRLAALYSFGCPELHDNDVLKFLKVVNQDQITYADISIILRRFVKSPFSLSKKERDIVEQILRYLDPFFYYRLIAQIKGIDDPFDEKIIKAHWLGLDLNERVDILEIQNILSEINSRFGPQRFFALGMKIYNLVGWQPHHNFIVSQLLGTMIKTGDRKQKAVEEINTCLVRGGRIIERTENRLLVEIIAFALKRGIRTGFRPVFCLKKRRETIGASLLEDIEAGNIVSVHLNEAREFISQETLSFLEKTMSRALAFHTLEKQGP